MYTTTSKVQMLLFSRCILPPDLHWTFVTVIRQVCRLTMWPVKDKQDDSYRMTTKFVFQQITNSHLAHYMYTTSTSVLQYILHTRSSRSGTFFHFANSQNSNAGSRNYKIKPQACSFVFIWSGTPPPPSVYLDRHWRHSCDVFPYCKRSKLDGGKGWEHGYDATTFWNAWIKWISQKLCNI